MAAQPADAGRGKCPICGRPSEPGYIPFCSRRCADVDLARWLRGAYVIPVKAESEDGSQPPDDADSETGSDPSRQR